LLEAIHIAKKSKRLPIIRDNYKLLANAYLNQKEYEKVIKYNDLFVELKDSIQNSEIKKNTEELLLKYETEKKEKENLVLKQESSEKDLTISNKNNYILFGSLVFLFVIVLLVLFQLKKIKKKNDDLKKSILKRQKLENELEQVRENIAKDFHDGMGNKLARINVLSDYLMKSDTLQINQLKNSLKNIRDDSDILFKETRDFMFSLNSKSDYLEEVVTYISDFGEDFYQSFKIDFYIEKNINQKFKLPYYWNRQIILIFKEAMTNVAKHSNASEVYFIIIQDKNQLKMSLKDNGQGFDFENIKTKNGLKNIIQRAQKIGAEIDFMNNKDSFEVQFKAVIK
jgi:signal transduction histidine kinase